MTKLSDASYIYENIARKTSLVNLRLPVMYHEICA